MWMRKEVRLGLAIGGVLLAVLIVYILAVTAGPDTPRTVALEQPPAQQGTGTQSADTSPSPVSDPAPPTQRDPFETSPAASRDDSETTSQAQTLGVDPWTEALATGRVPVMLTETPVPQPLVSPVGPAPAEANQPTPSTGAGSLNTTVPIAASNVADAIPSGGERFTPPATQPTDSTQSQARTHTVREGESFATIAAAVYGNASYYPHLIRANPTLDPRRLRPGMTINLPPVSEVRVDGTPRLASSGTSQVPLDPTTEYRVANGDSLERISLKLYGKRDRVDKLYELNKPTIGPDPARLKVGMVLKLPEPPTAR